MEIEAEQFSSQTISQSQSKSDSESEWSSSYREKENISSSPPEGEDTEGENTEGEDTEVESDSISDIIDGPKAVVFLSCLMQLFSVCPSPGCGSAIDPANRRIIQHGAAIVVNYTCNNSHEGTWCSSPTVGTGNSKVWALNSLLATFCLTCGLHISQV